ncbi:ABC transporter ATP-binding protein [Bacillus sp. AFS017336]|uniref:ABC transporter ATP-binding protein n=1 Tax=Bacillus sp. AFS017336 TaxID=2033489 RepID=UPI000BF0AEDE|nr:ABC transporter ATP-binding protein [Bacillus sp. AFS017336]PEL07011.1 multidrug ABC transporter [Bacillus sp. AFS017336]
MKDVIYFLKQIHSFTGKILYVNLLAMTFIGLLEGIGMILIIPIINMSGIVNLNVSGTPLSSFFDFINHTSVTINLPIMLGIYLLIVIGQNLVQRKITIQNTIIQEGFLRHLRVETYNKLIHSDWNFFIKKRKSDLINLLLAEVVRANSGTNAFLQFMSSLIFTGIQVVLAFWLSPKITTFVILFGLVLIIFNRKFLKRSLALGNRNYELAKSYFAGINDQINGIKDIKSNTLENSRMDWFQSITEKMQSEQVEYMKLKTTSQLYYKIASAVLIAIFIYIGVSLFHAQTAQLMLIIVIFSRLWPRVAGIQASMEQIATNLPSFKAVKVLQNECNNAKEFERDSNQLIKPIALKHEIECRNVCFQYNQNEKLNALQDINLVIPSNKMTAVVGRSGAGKSTLIDLLMGLNQPGKGEVLIDGTPIKSDNLLSLRKAISYVPQDPFLFNTTIRENLMLVEPNASDEQIWEALEFASAAEFVNRLPNKLDTLIGDRGIRLSGGERQRIVLARAILRNPSILVLDEATSALDTESEAKIQEAIERLKGKMTIIVIAHRLSTIRNSDQVVVLEQGRVIQKGGFNQLASEKKSMFSNLLQNQWEASL